MHRHSKRGREEKREREIDRESEREAEKQGEKARNREKEGSREDNQTEGGREDIPIFQTLAQRQRKKSCILDCFLSSKCTQATATVRSSRDNTQHRERLDGRKNDHETITAFFLDSALNRQATFVCPCHVSTSLRTFPQERNKSCIPHRFLVFKVHPGDSLVLSVHVNSRYCSVLFHSRL